MKLRLLSIAAAVGLVLGLTACGRPDATAPKGAGGRIAIRFQTDWYPQAEHGGFYQALAKGYYAEAGLDVTILPGGPGPSTPQKIIGGAADIAIHRSDDLMMQVAEGLPFVMLAAFMQHDPQAILLHAENPIDSFPELDGKAVMAVPGSNWIRYLQARYDIALQIIPMNFGLAQFMADKAFIQQCFITSEPYYVRRNGAHPKTLLIADSGYDPYRVIFTTRRFLEANPAAVQGFVAASLRGWHDFITGDPAPAKALIAARNEQQTDEFMDFSIASMKEYGLITGRPEQGERLGLMTPERLQAQHDALVDLKILERPLPVASFATFDFVPPDPAQTVDERE